MMMAVSRSLPENLNSDFSLGEADRSGCEAALVSCFTSFLTRIVTSNDLSSAMEEEESV